MNILHPLFEYEQASLRGIPLAKSVLIEFDPTKKLHHRYHRTQAGLYVILRHHKDGKIQAASIGEESSAHTFPNLDGQNNYVSNNFTCQDLVWYYNPTDKDGSICRCTTKHASGVKVTHAVDGMNGTILSVSLTSRWAKDPTIPGWQLEVTKTEKDFRYTGKALILHKYDFSSDGNIVETNLPLELNKRTINYEASISTILDLMKGYDLGNDKERKHLSSLDCLVFE